ncbi:hypothetical protein [Campylobacter sp. IFREMER_LSEM_CL2194]|uniref:hypothetical protein n=1 Tax=Campylobacter sp. IFREMER_LSEM_CL2194 TaxID=2911621 RepID=UPI0021E90A22|nr:hypothetical protein [Campylobacter sp. IFREMER_LSEM_CL2194]MCV3377626.1 hypothetical protein [Campylobacter sp. IFREMER_LSEM_CL2194]
MKKKNVVCFGSCDMYPTYGFVGGMREYGSKVISFGESNNDIFSQLYHLIRKENQQVINKADLIVVGIGGVFKENVDFYISLYKLFYEKLWNLQKKILVVIMPHAETIDGAYGWFHHHQCEYYGFNVIDIKSFLKQRKLDEFYMNYYDWQHPFYSFMSGISKRVLKNYDKLCVPKKNINSLYENIELEILSIKEMVQGDFDFKKVRTFTQYEDVCKFKVGEKIKIPVKYCGFSMIGIHSFNGVFSKGYQGLSLLCNNKGNFAIVQLPNNYVTPILYDFVIDNESYLLNSDNKKFQLLPSEHQYNGVCELGLVAFVFAKNIDVIIKNNDFYNKEVNISSQYNFSYLLEFLEEGKKFIEDYNKKQNQEDYKYYELGRALMVNSHSFFEYIKLPLVMLSVNIMRKQSIKIKNTIFKDMFLVYKFKEKELKYNIRYIIELGRAYTKYKKFYYFGWRWVKLYFKSKKLRKKYDKQN